MILCFDIGNTNVRGTICENGMILPERVSFSTDSTLTVAAFGAILSEWNERLIKIFGKELSVKGAIFASVVPSINQTLADGIFQAYGIRPLEVSSRMKLNYEIMYDDPLTLGADRIANAASAFKLYPEKDLIVISVGTAITFNVCLAERIFDGGIIAPGFGAAIESLAENTSLLFRVKLGKPERISARNTEEALKSGLYYGWISLIEGIVSRLVHEYQRDFSIILTGGAYHLVEKDLHLKYTADADLTMKGIFDLYKINS